MSIELDKNNFLEIEGLLLVPNYEKIYHDVNHDTILFDLPKIPQDILLIPCKSNNVFSIEDCLNSSKLSYLLYFQSLRWSQAKLDSMFGNAKSYPIKYKSVFGSPLNPFNEELTEAKIFKGKIYFDISKNKFKHTVDPLEKEEFVLRVFYNDFVTEIKYLDNPFELGYLIGIVID